MIKSWHLDMNLTRRDTRLSPGVPRPWVSILFRATKDLMGRGARIIMIMMLITKTSNVDCEHLKKNVSMDAARCWRNAVKFRIEMYTFHKFQAFWEILPNIDWLFYVIWRKTQLPFASFGCFANTPKVKGAEDILFAWKNLCHPGYTLDINKRNERGTTVLLIIGHLVIIVKKNLPENSGPSSM